MTSGQRGVGGRARLSTLDARLPHHLVKVREGNKENVHNFRDRQELSRFTG